MNSGSILYHAARTAAALGHARCPSALMQVAQPNASDSPLSGVLNRVHHADSLNFMRQLPTASIDLVLTDPPYLVKYQDKAGRKIINDDNSRWLFPAFAEIYRVLKENSYCVSFYGWSKVDSFLNVWRACGFVPVGHFVWVKDYASCVRRVQMKHEAAFLLAKGNPPIPAHPPADVLPWKYSGNTLHPTQKPVPALTPLVEAFCPVGGIVLDPFAGSGSTGVAAHLRNRRFILIEKDAGYFANAKARLERMFHKLAAGK